jgi:hypothetical protein
MHWLKKGSTFFDFLTNYIKTTLGADQGNAELAKPVDQRHPILQWYQGVCASQEKVEGVAGSLRIAILLTLDIAPADSLSGGAPRCGAVLSASPGEYCVSSIVVEGR